MKTYIIREATFEYDDSRYGYKSADMEVLHTFQNEQQARQTYLHLERERYATETLDFYYTQTPTEGEHPWDKLAHYIEKECKVPFQNLVSLPKTFWEKTTDDQMERILSYTGLRFYVLTVFENEPVFYKLVSDDASIQRDDAYKTWYHSYQEAFEVGLQVWIEEVGCSIGYGSDLAQMTQVPHMVRAYLQNCTCLQYDEETMCLKMKENWQGSRWDGNRQEQEASIAEARGLIALLEEKPFAVEKVRL